MHGLYSVSDVQTYLVPAMRCHTLFVQQCTDGDVPCGPINSIDDIFNDPHFAARDTIETYEHPKLGPLKVPGTFPRLSETPGRIDTLGPELGDWNDKLETLLADESAIRFRPNEKD